MKPYGKAIKKSPCECQGCCNRPKIVQKTRARQVGKKIIEKEFKKYKTK